MNRSRSRLIETSFDSRNFSSTEDLDEVDRLANHPFLRTAPRQDFRTWKSTSLRKSVSETEDCLFMGAGGALSVWKSVSNQGSPVGVSLPRSKGMIFNSKLSRSTTVNVHLNDNSSVSSYNYNGNGNKEEDNESVAFSSSSPVNSAPSSWIFSEKQNANNSSIPYYSEIPPHSPLSQTFQCPQSRSPRPYSCDSGGRITVRAVIESGNQPVVKRKSVLARECMTPPPPAKPKLSIFHKANRTHTKALTHMDVLTDQDAQNRSTTPPHTAPLPSKFNRVPQNLLRDQQRKPSNESTSTGSNNECNWRQESLQISGKSHLVTDMMDSSSADSTPARKISASGDKGSSKQSLVQPVIKRGAEVAKPNITPKSVLQLSKLTGENSSCSSAMSSLESIRSNASDGLNSLVSSESGAVSSMSSQSSDMSLPTTGAMPRQSLITGKIQVLSPISDKSQEPSYTDTPGDAHQTPKVSPTEQQENNNGSAVNDNAAVKRAMAVPWEIPKLRRRLQNLNHQGSDSGISTTSQDVAGGSSSYGSNNLDDLLNVPWDMPKLRKKKTNHQMNNNARPFSLPCPSKSCSQHQQDQDAIVEDIIAPPPPGFEDSGDEFYLSQSKPNQGTPEQKQKRQRPKMTLSFGIDPSLKTLMFATTNNSPFSLNDCEEIDPNMPLERQDWYHGSIDKHESESILRSHKEGAYLVRSVDLSKQEYVLSLKSSKGFIHMRIRRDPLSLSFRLCDFPRTFMGVSPLVHHYTRNRLPIKGAEHMCLKTPVKQQLL